MVQLWIERVKFKPRLEHCIAFRGRKLYCHNASLHPGKPKAGGHPVMNYCNIPPKGEEILLVASLYMYTETQDKHQPDKSVGSYAAFAFLLQVHSRPQRPGSFISAPRISTSGTVQFFEHVQRIRFVLSPKQICQTLLPAREV